MDRPLRGGPATTRPGPVVAPRRGPAATARRRPPRPAPTAATAARSPGRAGSVSATVIRGRQRVDPQRPLLAAAAAPYRCRAASREPPQRAPPARARTAPRRAARPGPRAGSAWPSNISRPGGWCAGSARSLMLGQLASFRSVSRKHHPLVEHGADLADQRGPVGGDDGAQADGAALAQDLQQRVDQPAEVVLLERREVPLPPVEQQQHPGQPLLAGRPRARCSASPANPCGGEQLLAPGDLAAQLAEQPLDPVGLVAGHHARRSAAARSAAAARRYRSRSRRCARRPARRCGDRAGEGAQHGGPAGAGRARHHQVPAVREVQGQRHPRLPGRDVGEAERDRRHLAGAAPRPAGATAGSSSSVIELAAAAPATGCAARPQPEPRRRAGDRVDQHRQVGLHRLVVGPAAAAGAGSAPAEPAPRHRDDLRRWP